MKTNEMKAIHKTGQKLWSMLKAGKAIIFAGSVIELEDMQVNMQTLRRSSVNPYHWIHYSACNEQGHPYTISHAHTDPQVIRECFFTGFYTAKQGSAPDNPCM